MSWGQKNSNIKYVSSDNKSTNKAAKYANSLITSPQSLVDNSLSLDYEKILQGGCVYLPHFFCPLDEFDIFNKLKEELKSTNIINWSKHSKYEDPTFSETFNSIVNLMAEHFNVQVMQTRLNYYKDGKDWKPFHHDRHAYGSGVEKIREDFTMGASFGASRTLEFKHDVSEIKFNFPQNNGDIFAFDSEINKKFMHGIPKLFKPIGERFSIIAWGKKN